MEITVIKYMFLLTQLWNFDDIFPHLPVGDIFQDPQWIPETMYSTETKAYLSYFCKIWWPRWPISD